VAIYTNLRPGAYRFEVTARHHHGAWNTSGASFAFAIPPHIYQTWPFSAACGAAAIAGGLALHRRRIRVLARIQRLEQMHALDLERARIAQDVHDEIGARLTSLNLLTELTYRDLDKPEVAERNLVELGSASRELFRVLDEIVWAASPRHDSLDSLANYLARYAQDYLRPAGIRCRLDIPSQSMDCPLTSDARHDLFIAAKEALHNVVRHARASQVSLRIGLNDEGICIRLRDDGCGFDPDSADSSRNGLVNMRQRLERFGGTMELKAQPGKGVEVSFRVRLKRP
jgi:signal transduction histidine kinase